MDDILHYLFYWVQTWISFYTHIYYSYVLVIYKCKFQSQGQNIERRRNCWNHKTVSKAVKKTNTEVFVQPLRKLPDENLHDLYWSLCFVVLFNFWICGSCTLTPYSLLRIASSSQKFGYTNVEQSHWMSKFTYFLLGNQHGNGYRITGNGRSHWRGP